MKVKFMPVDKLDHTPISRVVDYLRRPDDEQKVWAGLLFMEQNGIDPALRAHQLHAYLTAERFGIFEDAGSLTHAQVREIILDLRDAARAELNLRALSAQQRETWEYEVKRSHSWRADQRRSMMASELRQTDPSDLEEVERMIAVDNPELYSALKLFAKHNAKAKTFDESHSMSWARIYLDNYVAVHFPDIQAIQASKFINDFFDFLESR